ncbi:MurR/RpiR family transcriptional regulator [Bacillus chungangensis]|uniref:DNA-binding MurR/RpiR family transcriptional regulator n=1 Tax=Bacillus chungangensis TaxID=587633 RepID=A0ABT9WVB5_9BACI|nr:MurR/RpiR family transcriptional regulator [Bacillus chungangensis]MDQ0176715.1 DNA-binding MurR/RpiR family transcriptional regulator [Bacillus chungangensis]
MLNYLENYDDMTMSEKKVLKYIVENTELIPYLKISDLAEATFVSKTVIINLSQKLGYSGFKELKYHLSSLLKDEITETVNHKTSYKDSLQQSIFKTISLVDPNVLENCAQMIRSSKNVFIMARGTSKAAGYYLEHLLLSIGIQCIFIKDYNLSELFTNFVTENDLVIFISMSGNTKKIIESAKKVQMKKANMISMTSFQSNTLSNYTKNNLYCYTDSADTKRNDKISRIGFFLIIDLLIDQLSQNNNTQAQIEG